MVASALCDAFPTVASKKLSQLTKNNVRTQNFVLLRHTLLSTIPNGYVILRPKSISSHDSNKQKKKYQPSVKSISIVKKGS